MKLVSTLILCSLATLVFAQDSFVELNPFGSDTGASNGVAWGDFDGDGDEDIYICNGSEITGQANFFYRNDGGDTFFKITSGNIVTDSYISPFCTWGDFDNDNDLDLYVSSIQNFLGAGKKNCLYQNNGDGTFTKNISAGPPVTDEINSAAGGWGDYNNDSFLDLFVTNGYTGPIENALYSNDGDATFTKITGIDLVSSANATGINGFVWGDYDNDGDLDIFTSSGGGANREKNFLWRNDGSNVFYKLALFDEGDSQAASWGDYDNDGDLDLYIANHGTSETTQEVNFLYRNDGSDVFTKMSAAQAGDIVDDAVISKGSAWGDIDNDGDIDMFVTTPGDVTHPGYDFSNRLYLNNGSGYFSRLTGSVIDGIGFCFGTAMADYNKDGFLDILVATSTQNPVYKNNEPNIGNSNHWIEIKLIGTSSNKSGIGAHVKVNATINSADVWQMREIAGITGFGQNSLIAHFGLGDADIIEEILVNWPSGITQTLSNVAVDQILTITESENQLQTIPLTNGWNMFSLAVSPQDDHDMLEVLDPILDNLVKVIDENGNTVEKIFGTWQNYIGDWQPTEGYYIKVNANVDLQINGTEVETPLDIPLMNGWNMIGYPCLSFEQDAIDVLQALIDDDYLVKVIDEMGNTVEKIFGNWQNYVGNFQSGEGYYVKTTEACTLQVDCLESTQKSIARENQLSPEHFDVCWQNHPFKPMSAYFVINDNFLQTGDEIALFDGNTCVSAGCVHNFDEPLLLIASKNDGTGNGFVDDRDITIKIWKKSQNKEINVNMGNITATTTAGQEIYGIPVYQELGSIVFDINNKSFEIDNIPTQYILFQNYPNPFNPATSITFDLAQAGFVTLKLFDIRGRKVAVLCEQFQENGRHIIHWNAKNDQGFNVTSGVYFYELKVNGYSDIKKMIFMQ